jgi:polysaccharide pyruvyl transferase CsaB
VTIIGISGSYGGLNLGDEAILASTTALLRAAIPDVEIVAFSRNAEHTRLHQDVDRTLCPRTALREEITPEIERLDILLLGGGGILYDAEAKTYLREIMIAQACGVPTFAFAIGIGPLDGLEEQRAVRDGLNMMAGVTVRELSAKRLLEEIGVKCPVIVTGDPALLLTPEPFTDDMLRLAGIPDGATLVGMSVRERGPAAPELGESEYHRLIAEAADFIVRRFDARVVFVPMERADLREAHTVIARMAAPDRAYILQGDYGPRQILGLMEHFSLAVGMRLHFLIFAARCGVPLMSMPYSPKVSDFLDALGVADQSMIGEAHAGSVLADIDRLWDHREEQRRLVADRMPELQEMAGRTVPLVAEVIRQGRPVAEAALMVGAANGGEIAGAATPT